MLNVLMNLVCPEVSSANDTATISILVKTARLNPYIYTPLGLFERFRLPMVLESMKSATVYSELVITMDELAYK